MTTQNKKQLTVQRNPQGQIYSPVRAKWLFETPEERVRQEWLCVLVNEYGYALDQMAEELDLTGRGSAQARADLVIWRSKADKVKGKTPLLVVEYKSDNITISAADYGQGEMYARLCEAPFFVTHNNKETRFYAWLNGRRLETDATPNCGSRSHTGCRRCNCKTAPICRRKASTMPACARWNSA